MKKERWSRIHLKVLQQKGLRERDLKVYLALLLIGGRKSSCFPNKKTISKYVGIHQSHISGVITRLVNFGFIERKKGVKRKSNTYNLLLNKMEDNYWGRIPLSLLQNNDIKFRVFKVLCALSIYQGEKNKCYPSLTEISEYCNVGKSHIPLCIKELEALGNITVDRNQFWDEGRLHRKENEYKVLFNIKGESNQYGKLVTPLTPHQNEDYVKRWKYFVAHVKKKRGVELKEISAIIGKREADLAACLSDKKFEFNAICKKILLSDFLLGKTPKRPDSEFGDWVVSFDWLITENNYIKVLEGKYDTKIKERKVNRLELLMNYKEVA